MNWPARCVCREFATRVDWGSGPEFWWCRSCWRMWYVEELPTD